MMWTFDLLLQSEAKDFPYRLLDWTLKMFPNQAFTHIYVYFENFREIEQTEPITMKPWSSITGWVLCKQKCLQDH